MTKQWQDYRILQKKTKKTAIEDPEVMEETKVLLREQKKSLRISHDKIKSLREQAKS